MDRHNGGSFLHIFVMTFIVLFVILVIIPDLVDRMMIFFTEDIIPRNNSIIVFKDFLGEQETIIRFFETIKKIRNFM
ncbi:MAG: hypothetical protein APF77_18235 [Clostridia bacterium BRH_c25]|nr:MAG: hypothetical protein APF77_18235 [Clostridia bacterium BRH_c25]